MKNKFPFCISTTDEMKRNFLIAAKRRRIANARLFELMVKEFLKGKIFRFVNDKVLYELPILKGNRKGDILKAWAFSIKGFEIDEKERKVIYKGEEKKIEDWEKPLNEDENLYLKEELYDLIKDVEEGESPIDLDFLMEEGKKGKFFPVFNKKEGKFVLYPEEGCSFSEPITLERGLKKKKFNIMSLSKNL